MLSIYTNFHKIPHNIFSLGLSAPELTVILYLISLSNNKKIHPSKKTISKKVKLSKRTVDRAISSLTKKGFLEYDRGYTKGDLKKSNRYYICLEKIAPECTKKSLKQIERENQNEVECMEIIDKSIPEEKA